MSAELICDLCQTKSSSLKDFGEINQQYQVPGRIVHTCLKCSKKVDEKLKSLSIYYEKEISKDLREWLLDTRNKQHPLLQK